MSFQVVQSGQVTSDGEEARLNRTSVVGGTTDYEEKLRQDGLETILKYGIACNRKKCRVLLQK